MRAGPTIASSRVSDGLKAGCDHLHAKIDKISARDARNSGLPRPGLHAWLHQWAQPRSFIVFMLSAMITAAPHRLEAREVLVAVAANFIEPARAIAAQFERTSPHRVVLSFGSTGQFYAQIVQNAPFEVFLAADRSTPARAERDGYAIGGSAFTYAIGRLVLYSGRAGLVQGEATLRGSGFSKLAIANPATAPYGSAAVETLQALDLYDVLRTKIVQGNNIAQAFQFVDTGNAEIGFIALSQIARASGGSRWIVPENLHQPLAQDAVLLKAGAGNDGAREFLDFLEGTEARAVIESFGYATTRRREAR